MPPAPSPDAPAAWETVVGLEAHAQIAARSKLFSGAAAGFGGDPNTRVSLVDAAMPGMLPVINRECVEQAVRTGLGLGAEINLISIFDRKNYFYPDLPQGYQISQYSRPIVGRGRIEIDLPYGVRSVGIRRLHLEQDAGKSIHDRHPDATAVDLNRSGVALMEIVTEPDLRSAEEAASALAKLRSILRYLGTCDGNMEEGSLRADVNVSVRRPGAPYGVRCEIKNLNSMRHLRQAIEHEAKRQIGVLERGGRIEQETRLFDAAAGATRSMRSKEEAHDYRYFPDPDLPPLELDQDLVDRIRAGLPELPDARKARLVAAYGLSAYDAGVLVAERETAGFFEEAAKGRDAKRVANWITGELFGALNRAGKDIGDSPVTAARLGGLLDLIADGTISGRAAKQAFEVMFETGRPAAAVVEELGLRQLTDGAAIEASVDEAIAGNPRQVEQYRSGNRKVLGWFVGRVMQATGGRANPAAVNEALRAKLDG